MIRIFSVEGGEEGLTVPPFWTIVMHPVINVTSINNPKITAKIYRDILLITFDNSPAALLNYNNI
ncbi:MAG TPA: hypothetical protein VJ488_01890 [Dehalococcoidia bacterium]|nr:hypothetical protein [Dehalococcoidia bacterium]